MNSATPPYGGAQNDSIVGGVRVHIGMKGGFSPPLEEQILLNCRYLSVHPTKTGVRVFVFVLFYHFPSEGFWNYPWKQHLFKIISIQLLTPENLF